MRATNMKNSDLEDTTASGDDGGSGAAASRTAHAAAPGITGPTFNLTRQPAYITQPDGAMVYSWGYGCNGAPAGLLPPRSRRDFCSTHADSRARR